MARLTLILGGVRSGKSRLAEELAAAAPPVIYLATALAGDPEMVERIARHRQRRSPDWRTIEEPWNVVSAVAEPLRDGCVVLECLTLWLTNLMLGSPQRPALEHADIFLRKCYDSTYLDDPPEVGWAAFCLCRSE